MDGPPANDCCSVCHENFNLPCQANCSHWFCSNCIMQVWDFGPALQPCKCPICRRLITLLIPTEATIRQRHEPEANQILEHIEQYNHRFGGGPQSLIQRLRDLPFFARRMLRDLMDPQRSLPLVHRARMIFAMVLSAIYVLSPIDILPEGSYNITKFISKMFQRWMIHGGASREWAGSWPLLSRMSNLSDPPEFSIGAWNPWHSRFVG